MDYVIDYRFKKNILNIKEEDLLKLRKEFINLNKININNRVQIYYKTREKEIYEEIAKINESFKQEKDNYKLLLKKVNDLK